MSSYERALAVARAASPAAPELDEIVEASARARRARTEEEQAARAGARRWLLFAAAVWGLLAPAVALDLGSTLGQNLRETFSAFLTVLPMALLLIWAARMSGDPRFRSAILTRGIAAANLIMALIYTLPGFGPTWALFAVLLAVAAGRSLWVLGEHGLDASDDPASSFAPVAFRGLLLLALVMACTDGMALLFQTALGCVQVTRRVLADPSYPLAAAGLMLGLTAGASALMAVNVWGLSHLRTWALITNLVANVVIATLAMNDVLWTNPYHAAALTTTAAIQMLLPIPIFAAARGHRVPRRVWEVGGVVVRLAIPALVVATIVMAVVRSI